MYRQRVLLIVAGASVLLDDVRAILNFFLHRGDQRDISSKTATLFSTSRFDFKTELK